VDAGASQKGWMQVRVRRGGGRAGGRCALGKAPPPPGPSPPPHTPFPFPCSLAPPPPLQVLFLLYHYFEAREIYNAIRIFIASYVWMTGFGNFLYYYKTGDYCIGRWAGRRVI
jgi:hypothetical protein